MSATPATDYIDRDGFRANVGIILTRGSGELFLGGRVGGRGWQFPQGGVNRGERVEDALYRELKEEIGLEPQDVRVLGSTQGWLRYRLPRQYVRDRCIGQKQRWFLLQLVAEETKLRFDSTNQPEFDIKATLEPLTFRSVSLHDERGQKEDIENYIKSVVNTNRRMREWEPELKQLVIDVLTEQADCM